MLAVESKRLHHTDRHSNVILQSMLIKCFKIGFTKWGKVQYMYILYLSMGFQWYVQLRVTIFKNNAKIINRYVNFKSFSSKVYQHD